MGSNSFCEAHHVNLDDENSKWNLLHILFRGIFLCWALNFHRSSSSRSIAQKTMRFWWLCFIEVTFTINQRRGADYIRWCRSTMFCVEKKPRGIRQLVMVVCALNFVQCFSVYLEKTFFSGCWQQSNKQRLLLTFFATKFSEKTWVLFSTVLG